MEVFRVSLQLLDYVFYATVERGKVYETGAFIHNYSLAYALGLAQGETYTYARAKQVPHYQEELAPLNGSVYLTPASPDQVTHRVVQWNTLREGYAFPGKPPSLGYPDWGFARVLRPGSRFTFYIVVPQGGRVPQAPSLNDLIVGHAVWIRLGKFSGKARLQAEAAEAVAERNGPFEAHAFLNWHDLESDPIACDVVAASLPTRLLASAHFAEGPYYEAGFGEARIRLPVRMRFLARSGMGD